MTSMLQLDADHEMQSALSIFRRGWAASPELRRGAGVTLTCALLGALGRVVLPILVQQVLDRGIDGDEVDMGVVTGLCTVAALVVITTALLTRTSQRRLASASEHALFGLRTRAFQHIHRLSIAHHAEERRGALVARVTTDIETMSQFFTWGGIAWVIDGLVILIVFATMLVFDWRLALITLVAVLPLIPVLRFLQARLVRAYDRVRTCVADLLTAVSEVVTGAAAVRSYGVQDQTTRRVQTRIHAEKDAQIRGSLLGALMFPSGEIVSVFTISVVVVSGVAIGTGGGLSAGELTAFVLLVGRFLEPVAEFTEILDQTQTAIVGWSRVLDVLDTELDVVDPDDGAELPHGAPSVEVRHVSFRYRQREGSEAETPWALRDVSVAITPATRVAVVGATGSGKTTFARLLTRLADPVEGHVLISGIDLRDVRPSSLRSNLVMVPQEPFLFDTTIGDNVRYGRRDASDADVELAFVELGLESWLEGLAHGLDTPVGERGEHLSAGERQLVALARAYVANPSCLVLDEATSSVDPATEARLGRAIDSLSRGRTSIAIAHRLSTAERADLVLVFHEARLVEVGHHDQLVAGDGVYARLHASWLDATVTT